MVLIKQTTRRPLNPILKCDLMMYLQVAKKMDASTKVEILRASCCVAGANGDSSEAEKVVLQRLAREIGVGYASLNAMMERAETDPEFHEQQFAILKGEPKHTMAILFEVAMSDGSISEEEVAVLRKLAQNLNVPADVFEQLKTVAIDSIQ